jgi:S-adenosylmethionine:tRNA ribosyltransferase-isomerase
VDLEIRAFDFELPGELIAQRPLDDRAGSRLLVYDRARDAVAHAHFYELGRYLQPGDLLVANNSRVIPARLVGVRERSGGPVELLLLRPAAVQGVWEVLARPGRRLHAGDHLVFGDGRLRACVEEGGRDGTRHVRFDVAAAEFEQILEQLGELPLPPYIKERLDDPERYQTVYAKEAGSVAAPTAGLHFTPELLGELASIGVDMEFLTLHVGLGTFRPMQVERVEDHQMHEEYYRVSRQLVRRMAIVRQRGNRVVSVGTTTVRALESAARTPCQDDAEVAGWTDMFIYPGVPLLATDALITNFHLPRSTLLLLVSTLIGQERLLELYREAVAHRYRFFSFGDAMLIL